MERGGSAVFQRPSDLSEEKKIKIIKRLWDKDPSLWTLNKEEQDHISNRLGWLEIIGQSKEKLDEVIEFSRKVRESAKEHVVLLGMGGSSLFPKVLTDIFGSQPGWPQLIVLDTTDPDTIEETAQKINLAKTLFIVASKSGSTLEPNALFQYFWSLAREKLQEPGRNFVAITDPGSPLVDLASEHNFLKIFLNPPDIGGRYAALSYFGLVPGALLGLDLEIMLQRAEEAAEMCKPINKLADNPGFNLGAFMAEYGVLGRDKLTILANPNIQSFCLWLEQLIAESTGKDTRGLVPIVGESTGIPGFYGAERIFVHFRLKDEDPHNSLAGFVKELREAEFPVYEIVLNDLYDLGGQCFIWEFATALASHFINVNPFNEPDVVETKKHTKEFLEIIKSSSSIPAEFWIDPQSNINFRTSKMVAMGMKSLPRALRDIFHVLPSWGYLAFLPYLPYNEEVESIFGEMRYLVRQEKGCATTFGYGPRYLHSTGQVHKGGPLSSAFIIFTRKRKIDYPEVPGFGTSFWHIQFSQALGDFEALAQESKRVIHVHLASDYLLGLKSFAKVLSRAVRM